LEAGLATVIPETLTQIGETARHALKEMRLFIHQLRPLDLEAEGLLGALHQRLAAVEGRVGMQTRLLADETISLTIEQQTDLYYIVQEALNNILRHAGAHSITVYLGREEKQVVLEILDDGCGFDPSRVTHGGMGLPNIKQRATNLGGTLKISSIPNQGTRIRVVLEEPR
jgi:signal transduction histidine kinase